MKIAPIFLIGTLLLSACTRNAVNEPELRKYVFTNNLDKHVIVRIGDTINQKAVAYLRVAPHSFEYAPDTFDKPGMSYYWITDDYLMSDWSKRTLSQWHIKNYIDRPYNIGVIHSIEINPTTSGQEIRYCLKGVDSPNVWKVTDAFDPNGANIWSTLTGQQKNINVVLHFNKKATFNTIDISESFNYSLVDSSTKFVLKNDKNSAGYYSKTAGYIRISNNMRPAAPLHTESPDTLYLKLAGEPVYYLLVKQK